jgi:hypothetical protein
MSKRVIAKAWKRKGLTQDLATGIPFFGCIVAGAYHSQVFFLVGIGFGALSFVLQRMRFRRCVCETCGAALRRQMKHDSPITFYCTNCDTIWTTGLIQDGPT